MRDSDTKVGIYGGTFDPPHAAHVMIAAYALSCLGLDHLLVLPCADHPFGKKMTPFDQRVEMARLAFSCFGDSVEIMDIERHLPAPSYTINTIRKLKELYPDVEFTLLIGSDNGKDLKNWYMADELRAMVDISVMARGGQGDVVFPPVSSTMVRGRARQAQDISALVPVGVAAFIREHGLYRDAS